MTTRPVGDRYGQLQIGGNLLVEPMFDLRPHVEVATPSREAGHRARQHPRAGLEDVDDRVGTLIDIWAVQHEEIRKPADSHAEIGTRVQTPTVVQTFTTDADDVETGEIVAGFESCRRVTDAQCELAGVDATTFKATPATDDDLRVQIEEYEILSADPAPGAAGVSATQRLVYADHFYL